MPLAWSVFRYTVFAGVALTAIAAFAVMAVQQRRLSPFGRAARTIRRLTDPMLKPLERRVLRSGGNPQSAPWLLLAIGVLGGILLISGAEWIIGQGAMIAAASQGGARSMIYVLVSWALRLLWLALIVRVIGSWLGKDRYNTSWMRPVYAMTEWILAPLRRVLPNVGPFDISPLVAMLLIELLRGVVLRLL
jgi:YggT family protein